MKGGFALDYFSFCLNGLSLTAQGALHVRFVSHLTGKQLKIRYFFAYLCLLFTIAFLSERLAVNEMVSIGAGVLVLYGISRFALGNQRPASWTAAVLAFYITQLSFGVLNSAEAMLFPRLVGSPWLYAALLAAQAFFCVICAGAYAAVQKLLSLPEGVQMPYMSLLLFPGFFFLSAELYILHTSYSFVASSVLMENEGKHGALLFLQALGLAALFCTLYAYRHVCLGFQAQTAVQSLTQAAQAQKVYIAEAQARYAQTKSFRHDIRNHLSVLKGLLNNGKLEESKIYLQKLETASESLAFPCQTGNPVVDILLGEKLGLAKAKGITAEVSLVLPNPCGIDDFDLCVIFANALDNAVNACQKGEEAGFIRIMGKRQGDFYMLTFENSCPAEPLPPSGTGLHNIRSAAEKYHGAVLIEKKDQNFSLNVLLNISLHPKSISGQTY
jgi:hypothetical protein